MPYQLFCLHFCCLNCGNDYFILQKNLQENESKATKNNAERNNLRQEVMLLKTRYNLWVQVIYILFPPFTINLLLHLLMRFLPSEEFELTAKLLAHMKTYGKLILKPLIYLTANSQDDLTL